MLFIFVHNFMTNRFFKYKFDLKGLQHVTSSDPSFLEGHVNIERLNILFKG